MVIFRLYINNLQCGEVPLQGENGEICNLQEIFLPNLESEEEFAEYIYTELNCKDIPDEIQGCIDWQLVWDTAYRFDFSSFEYGDYTYFFHNNF